MTATRTVTGLPPPPDYPPPAGRVNGACGVTS